MPKLVMKSLKAFKFRLGIRKRVIEVRRFMSIFRTKKNDDVTRSKGEEATPYYLHEVGSEREEDLLNSLAQRIIAMGLETPAIIFLEMSKPLAYIGGQMLFALYSPVLDASGLDVASDYLRILEKRDNVERLIRKIENKSS